MHEWQSLSHVKWECKYHLVIVPKYRRKVFYGRFRQRIGVILRDLCRQRGGELLEGHCMPDHIHMCVSIPPKYSVSRAPTTRVAEMRVPPKPAGPAGCPVVGGTAPGTPGAGMEGAGLPVSDGGGA